MVLAVAFAVAVTLAFAFALTFTIAFAFTLTLVLWLCCLYSRSLCVHLFFFQLAGTGGCLYAFTFMQRQISLVDRSEERAREW